MAKIISLEDGKRMIKKRRIETRLYPLVKYKRTNIVHLVDPMMRFMKHYHYKACNPDQFPSSKEAYERFEGQFKEITCLRCLKSFKRIYASLTLLERVGC